MHQTVNMSISSLYCVSLLFENSPTAVVSSANLITVFVGYVEMQSNIVYSE